jgi:Spy/CpxP family protein refolding chaperone
MKFRLLEPWRSRLLWLSLALNVFAAALIAAPHVLGHPSGGPPGPPSFDNLVQRIARGLEPKDAEAFKAAMAKERPWYELGRQKLDEARDNVAATVARTPYDPAAANAALQAMQDRMREGAVRFDESLSAAVGAMSPEGRTHLAQSLRQRRR